MTVHRRPDLLRGGLTDQRLRTAVAHGSLARVRRGSFAVGAAHWLDPVRALLAVHPAAAASHRTSAAVLGLADPPDRHEVTMPHDTGVRPDPTIQVHRTRHPFSTCVVDGVRVTSPARTAVDVARRWGTVDGVVVADAALTLGICVPDDLGEALREIEGLRGARRAHRAVALARSGAQSPMETRLRLTIVDGGLPEPVLQHPVHTRRRTYHVDLAWPDLMIGSSTTAPRTTLRRRRSVATGSGGATSPRLAGTSIR